MILTWKRDDGDLRGYKQRREKETRTLRAEKKQAAPWRLSLLSVRRPRANANAKRKWTGLGDERWNSGSVCH